MDASKHEQYLKFIANQVLANRMMLMTLIQAEPSVPADLRIFHYDKASEAFQEWSELMDAHIDKDSEMSKQAREQQQRLHQLLQTQKLVDEITELD